MGAGVSERKIKYHLRKMANKYPGLEFRVLRASNGETSILPVDPQSGFCSVDNPKKLWLRVTIAREIEAIPTNLLSNRSLVINTLVKALEEGI